MKTSILREEKPVLKEKQLGGWGALCKHKVCFEQVKFEMCMKHLTRDSKEAIVVVPTVDLSLQVFIT